MDLVNNLKKVVVFFEGDWNENYCCVYGENFVEEIKSVYGGEGVVNFEKVENGLLGSFVNEDGEDEFGCFVFDLDSVKGYFKYNEEKGCFLRCDVVEVFDDVDFNIECDVEVFCDLDEKIILIK